MWIAMIMWNCLSNISFLSKRDCMDNKGLSLFQRKLIAEIPHSYSHHQTCVKEKNSGVENDLRIIKYLGQPRWSIYVPIQEEAYESYCNHQLAEEYTVHLTNENELFIQRGTHRSMMIWLNPKHSWPCVSWSAPFIMVLEAKNKSLCI